MDRYAARMLPVPLPRQRLQVPARKVQHLPGHREATTTSEQDSDAKIDQENNKADRTVGKICKNC